MNDTCVKKKIILIGDPFYASLTSSKPGCLLIIFFCNCIVIFCFFQGCRFHCRKSSPCILPPSRFISSHKVFIKCWLLRFLDVKVLDKKTESQISFFIMLSSTSFRKDQWFNQKHLSPVKRNPIIGGEKNKAQ